MKSVNNVTIREEGHLTTSHCTDVDYHYYIPAWKESAAAGEQVTRYLPPTVDWPATFFM